MHHREGDVIRMSDWPKIPEHAPMGPPDAGVAADLGDVVQDVLERLRQDGRVEKKTRLVHIRNFRSAVYRLADDLAVSIDEEGDSFIARSFDTSQYGLGASTDDAISHLCAVIEEYYEILKEEKGNLSTSLESHLRYLDSVLTPL